MTPATISEACDSIRSTHQNVAKQEGELGAHDEEVPAMAEAVRIQAEALAPELVVEFDSLVDRHAVPTAAVPWDIFVRCFLRFLHDGVDAFSCHCAHQLLTIYLLLDVDALLVEPIVDLTLEICHCIVVWEFNGEPSWRWLSEGVGRRDPRCSGEGGGEI
jgi:hypothetical protein